MFLRDVTDKLILKIGIGEVKILAKEGGNMRYEVRNITKQEAPEVFTSRASC